MKAIAVSLAVSDIGLTATCSAIGGTHEHPVQASGSQHLAQVILTPVGADTIHFHVSLQMQKPDLLELQDSAPAGDPPQRGSLCPPDGDLRDHCPVQPYEEAPDVQLQV